MKYSCQSLENTFNTAGDEGTCFVSNFNANVFMFEALFLCLHQLFHYSRTVAVKRGIQFLESNINHA